MPEPAAAASAPDHRGTARLVRYGERALRRTCRAITPSDTDLPVLIEAMWGLMLRHGGVGLAAPQAGDDRRLIVVKDPRRGGRGERLVLVNPVLRELSPESAIIEEGCLSFPGLYLRIARPRALTVEFLAETGLPRRLTIDGMLARIVLHEIDHLDGTLFIDHLSPWRRRLLWWRLRRLAGAGSAPGIAVRRV